MTSSHSNCTWNAKIACIQYSYILNLRERESAKDADDRLREQEELDELKAKIYSNPTVKDPDAEYQKRVREMEAEFLPPGTKQVNCYI